MGFRSSDLFLGLPYDIIVGALMLIEIARKCNLEPSILGINLKDAHIYKSHKQAVLEYYKKPIYKLPIYYDKNLKDYKSGEYIKAKLIK